MNERIKALAEQAGLRFTQLMSNPMVPVVDGKETDLEKFAQLIVRECVDTYDHWATHSMDKNAFVVAKTHVKEHFGFKE
jgi:hypothetical protein